jgi:transcriptional regulator with XRE-family HTH domain
MDATVRKYVGRTARAARLRLGLTQAQVAQRAELAVAVYGRVERGGMMLSLPTLLRVCRVLEVDANTLLGFTAPAPPPWFSPPQPKEERPAVRELLGTARRLRRRQLAALRLVAHAMLTDAPTDETHAGLEE